jgi:hypothetical protein
MRLASSALRRESDEDRHSLEADRLAALETAIAVIHQALDVQFKRMAAMQAELDRLTARTIRNN